MNIHLTISTWFAFHPSLPMSGAYTQTKLRHADIDEPNRKLRSDNDTLRSQNSDLAKELVGVLRWWEAVAQLSVQTSSCSNCEWSETSLPSSQKLQAFRCGVLIVTHLAPLLFKGAIPHSFRQYHLTKHLYHRLDIGDQFSHENGVEELATHSSNSFRGCHFAMSHVPCHAALS